MFMALDDVRVLRHLTPDYLYLNRDAFRECDMVAMDLNLSDAALRTAIELARQYDKPVCVDPTSTDIAHRLFPFLSQVNLITPNLDEAAVLLRCGRFGDAELDAALSDSVLAARQLVSLGVEAAVITQAEKGACYATEHESGEFPALRCEIVDTTGAGDALTATVIFGMMQGLSVGDALQLGLRAASLTLRSAYTVAPELSVDRLYGLDN
jgi:pseudouridine kinase